MIALQESIKNANSNTELRALVKQANKELSGDERTQTLRMAITRRTVLDSTSRFKRQQA